MKVTIDRVEQIGDQINCAGTVDGVPVFCHVWASHLSTLKDDTARQTYIAKRLAYDSPPRPLTVDALTTKSEMEVTL